MDVVALLAPYFDFSKHREGRSNLQTSCHCPRKHPSYYIYVGSPGANRIPGTAYCHRCGESWGLVRLLKELGAPPYILDKALESIKESVEKADRAKKIQAKVSILDRITPLPEEILGMFDFSSPYVETLVPHSTEVRKMLDVGFDPRTERVTFAIRDHVGRLAAISGRASPATKPSEFTGIVERYLVYRRRELGPTMPRNYEPPKGQILYGLFRFYLERMMGIGDDEHRHAPVIICEGFKAVMAVIDAGYEDVVGLMGDYITDDQILLLSSITKRVILFLDDDLAGRRATSRAAQRLRDHGILSSIATYPRPAMQQSPDDLSQEEIDAALEEAVPELRWRLITGYKEAGKKREWKKDGDH